MLSIETLFLLKIKIAFFSKDEVYASPTKNVTESLITHKDQSTRKEPKYFRVNLSKPDIRGTKWKFTTIEAGLIPTETMLYPLWVRNKNKLLLTEW